MTDDLDEPVHLVPYDPSWPQLYSDESRRLRSLATFISILAIEHFGSTAIPGMAAKPIIDILAGVQQLPIAPEEIQVFKQAGYEYLGEAGVPERLYFRKRGIQDFNLAVVVFGGRHWSDNLLLRDYLRHNPVAAAEYESEKRQVIAKGATTLLAYSRAKSDCVSRLLTEAHKWQMLKKPKN